MGSVVHSDSSNLVTPNDLINSVDKTIHLFPLPPDAALRVLYLSGIYCVNGSEANWMVKKKSPFSDEIKKLHFHTEIRLIDIYY